MAPPFDDPSLHLILFDESFVIHKIPADEKLPTEILEAITRSAGSTDLISITRTSEEISIVCNAINVRAVNDDIQRWKCIKIKGPMHHGQTGILCDFSAPLKRAEIPIFAISTWNTDYILVPEAKTEDAVKALENDRWKFESNGHLQS